MTTRRITMLRELHRRIAPSPCNAALPVARCWFFKTLSVSEGPFSQTMVTTERAGNATLRFSLCRAAMS